MRLTDEGHQFSGVVGILPTQKPSNEKLQLLSILAGQTSSAISNSYLHSHVNLQNTRLEEAYMQTIETLRFAVETRDKETRGHSERVSNLASDLAQALQLPNDQIELIRTAGLFHDIGKPYVFTTDENGKDHFRGHAAYSEKVARKILKRLKFDNDTLNAVCTLVKNHSWYPELSGKGVRFCAYQIGPELFEQFLKVKRADILAHHPQVIEQKLNYLDEVIHIWEDVKLHQDCLSLKELAVTGKDLIAMGMQPGPGLGQVLQKLLEDVLEFPEHNTREYLLETVHRMEA